MRKDEIHEAEVMGQVPGAMVVIKTPVVGFNIAKLVSTRDDYDTWTVQWYNIKEIAAGASRLSRPE